jgi:hypothetical protein
MNEFTIPLQPLTTATGSQSSEPITLDPALWDAIRYAADCAEEDKREAWDYVRALFKQQQQKGTSDHA